MQLDNQRELYKHLLEETANELVSEEKQEDFKEIIEHNENELLKPSSAKIGKIVSMPKDDEVISWEQDGKTPLSYYNDEKWLFRDFNKTVTISFAQNYPDLGVDLSEPNAAPLRAFQKLMVYQYVPGKNIFFRSNKALTTLGVAKQFLLFFIFLYKNGYLILDFDSKFKTLESLSVQILRSEVLERMERNEGRHLVVNFAYAIGKWILISKSADLPKEFVPNFSAKEFWGGGLSKEVALYDAKMTQGWTAISFDNLLPMIKTAQCYINNYSEDILYMRQKYLDSLLPRHKTYESRIISIGRTKHIYEDLFNYDFTLNPETQEPWFKITSKRVGNRFGRISATPISEQFDNLMSAAIFMLFIWTAMRLSELRNIEADALIINNFPIDLNQDVRLQVEQGDYFDLRRIVTKTEGDLGEKSFLLPLPKIGAQAFAIIFELFRVKRNKLGSKYLMPEKAWDNYVPNQNSYPISPRSIYDKFQNFCVLSGVERHYPHQCRKTLATLMINHDPSSLELIRDLLCHKSVAMTIIYLMSLPGVAEDVQNYILKKQNEKVIDFVTDGSNGKLAGAAGNRILDAIARNPLVFKGELLATTVKTLLKVFSKETNFELIQTPAAWCLRFPSKVPWNAPCLSSHPEPGEYIQPNPEKCRPWECKYAGHKTSDLNRIKNSLKWAQKAVSQSNSSTSKAFYEKQVKYWGEVVYQLENGRPDIVALDIIKHALALGN